MKQFLKNPNLASESASGAAAGLISKFIDFKQKLSVDSLMKRFTSKDYNGTSLTKKMAQSIFHKHDKSLTSIHVSEVCKKKLIRIGEPIWPILQNNVLIPKLTAREHLQLYAKVKMNDTGRLEKVNRSISASKLEKLPAKLDSNHNGIFQHSMVFLHAT